MKLIESNEMKILYKDFMKLGDKFIKISRACMNENMGTCSISQQAQQALILKVTTDALEQLHVAQKVLESDDTKMAKLFKSLKKTPEELLASIMVDVMKKASDLFTGMCEKDSKDYEDFKKSMGQI